MQEDIISRFRNEIAKLDENFLIYHSSSSADWCLYSLCYTDFGLLFDFKSKAKRWINFNHRRALLGKEGWRTPSGEKPKYDWDLCDVISYLEISIAVNQEADIGINYLEEILEYIIFNIDLLSNIGDPVVPPMSAGRRV